MNVPQNTLIALAEQKIKQNEDQNGAEASAA